MAWDRNRIEEDLRGLLDGEVRCDVGFSALYANDASIHEIQPLGVVRPRHLQDVVHCVEYAAEQGISLHPRGAGSGVSGESLGSGLIVDFSCHFRGSKDIGTDGEVVVQPGVVLSELNRELAKVGRCFGPDPATASVSTVGGVIGRNSSGSRFVALGAVRDSVSCLQVVLADGRVIEVGRTATPASLEAASTVDGLTNRLERVLSARTGQEPDAIAQMPSGLRPGYAISGSGPYDSGDLAKLFVGSEGTLGLITRARLRTSPLPRSRGVALLSFRRLRDAANAVQRIRDYSISACDLLDRRLLSLAKEATPGLGHWIEPEAEAMLLVEVSGSEYAAVRDELERMARRAVRRELYAGPPRITLEATEVATAWQLVKLVVPRLLRLRGKTRPLPFMEDAWVPPEHLPELIERAQRLLRDSNVIASVYAHAAHGELHLRPLLDLADPGQLSLMQSLAAAYFDVVFELGGTVSAEHAWGLSRSWYLRDRYPAWNARMGEVKRVFDPGRIFNPGRLGDAHPSGLTVHVRRVSVPSAVEDGGESDDVPVEDVLLPQVSPSAAELLLATRQCNGCARCRVSESPWRMCPPFHVRPREEASPRSKANLLRAVLAGELPVQELASDTMKGIADLCIHCHQCRIECPAEVDIPGIVAEWKSQHVATNGMRLRDWWLARPERFAQRGHLSVKLTNWMLGNRQARWLLEKFSGVAAERKLPRLAPTPFLKIAQRQRLGSVDRGAKRKVAYFVDVYANWFDPELAQATVSVLRHNGFSVLVPLQQRPSGMPLVVTGGADIARREARHNISQLAELVRVGYTIVTTEPAAALCLTRDYPLLLPDDDEAQLVAQNTLDVGALLWREHLQGRLELDFRPVNMRLIYHLPCHLRALGDDEFTGDQLLQLIPGLRLVAAPQGCSGMAGMYGVKRQNYRFSLRMGRNLISAVRDSPVQGGTTECSSCKLQMEQGTNKPTVHPLKVLAWAYQSMHFADDPLQRVSQPLIVT